MDITLKVDEELLKRSRRVAAEHGTDLDEMIEDYLKRISKASEVERDAEEFARLAKNKDGRSPEGYEFDRDEVHERESK